jgi:hypothetical protein
MLAKEAGRAAIRPGLPVDVIHAVPAIDSRTGGIKQ